MSEELVPPDFLLSATQFEHAFMSGIPTDLADLAIDGKLTSLKNRFTAWRIFLGILPSSGSLEVWMSRLGELRLKYQEITESQRVLPT
jgi:hypothetical protein